MKKSYIYGIVLELDVEDENLASLVYQHFGAYDHSDHNFGYNKKIKYSWNNHNLHYDGIAKIFTYNNRIYNYEQFIKVLNLLAFT